MTFENSYYFGICGWGRFLRLSRDEYSHYLSLKLINKADFEYHP